MIDLTHILTGIIVFMTIAITVCIGEHKNYEHNNKR